MPALSPDDAHPRIAETPKPTPRIFALAAGVAPIEWLPPIQAGKTRTSTLDVPYVNGDVQVGTSTLVCTRTSLRGGKQRGR
jgi:hypothetical protein